MRKHSLALIFAAIMLSSSSAMALGSFGIRLGTGVSFPDEVSPEPTVTPFAVGLAYSLNLAVAEVEVNALYWRDSGEYDVGQGQKLDLTTNRLAIPILGRASLPVIPKLFSISVGAGLEPRFLLSTDPSSYEDEQESMVLYLPVSVVGKISVPLIGTIGVEARYEHQLNDSVKNSDARINQLVFMGGFDF